MPSRRTTVLAASIAAAVVIGAGALVATASTGSGHASAAGPAAASGGTNAVLEWNTTLLGIVRDPRLQPKTIHPTRSSAIMNAAVYDAVDAIDGSRAQYLTHLTAARSASEPAAAATAAHDVLVALYPGAKATLDTQLRSDLARLSGSAVQQGEDVGHAAAAALLGARAHDGASVKPPAFAATSIAGRYQPVPPAFTPPVFRQWGKVQPFTMSAADQFRSPAPPALDSAEYAATFRQVQSRGAKQSTTRTADETQAAGFWNAPIQDFWTQVTLDAAARHSTSLPDTARLFAQVDLAVADTTIAFYDTKYSYDRWRPVSAIRGAGGDGNAATTPDPAWTPLYPTQADPSYPGAHSAVSAAAADVLDTFFGTDKDSFSLTSPVLHGVTRHFDSYSAAALEAGNSRIWAGVHFPVDHTAGVKLGRSVAQHVLTTSLQPTSTSGY
jgi:hypothetical protein